MTTDDLNVMDQMQSLIERWEAASDKRSIFLGCYRLMTQNMLAAIEQNEFLDSAWINVLLDHFAGYYFVALKEYERNPVSAPRVWRLAHDTALAQDRLIVQDLLLGINAHINYDLVLTLVDLLESEWDLLNEEQRSARYRDYCHVNDVIHSTIDAVQDQILDPEMHLMEFIDKVFGSTDERMVYHLLSHWREAVWENAVRLLDTREADERTHLITRLESEAFELGEVIGLRGLSKADGVEPR